jgi:hypothetical protein
LLLAAHAKRLSIDETGHLLRDRGGGEGETVDAEDEPDERADATVRTQRIYVS